MISPSQPELEAGAIYVGYEALRTPAKIALGDGKLSEATLRSNQSFFSTIDDHGQRKYRPCLVFSRLDRENLMICAMGTFCGDSRKDLADVYKHFIIPVYPNSEAKKGEFIARTTIPWAREAWIIGKAYTPQSRLGDRWCEHGVPMRIEGHEALDHIESWCRKRSQIWVERMKDPEFARRKQTNYKYCLHMSRKCRQQKISEKFQNALGSRVLPETIREENEPTKNFFDDDFPPLISTTSILSRISMSSSAKPPVSKGVLASNENPNPVDHEDTVLRLTPSHFEVSLSSDNLSESDHSSAERHPSHASTRGVNSGCQAEFEKPRQVTFKNASATSIGSRRTIRSRASVHSLTKKVSQALFGGPRSTSVSQV